MFQPGILAYGECGADQTRRCDGWLGIGLIIFLVISLSGTAKAQSFELAYIAAESDQEEQVKQFLLKSERMERAVDSLNRLFHFPRTVRVKVGGEKGPLHDPTHRVITIPYQFVSGLSRFSSEEEDILDVTIFVLYHEVGHALIDLLELPVPGGIEEAADALASLLSIELISDGGGPVFAAAGLIAGRESGAGPHPWFSEGKESHRFRQLICWVVGSDPVRLGWVADDAGIEAGVADRCPLEYEEMRNYWVDLLLPYLQR